MEEVAALNHKSDPNNLDNTIEAGVVFCALPDRDVAVELILRLAVH